MMCQARHVPIDQPTTFREYRSMITTRYSQPDFVEI